MTIPVESVPDGTILAPHHFYIGCGIALFAFIFVWRLYPRTGSTLTLIGLLIALDDVVQHIFGVPTPLDTVGNIIIKPLITVLE